MLYRLSYSRPLLTNQVYRPQRDGEEAAGDGRGGYLAVTCTQPTCLRLRTSPPLICAPPPSFLRQH